MNIITLRLLVWLSHFEAAFRRLFQPNAIVLGNAEIFKGATEAHEKLTAQFLFQPTGESGYINTGNILNYKSAQERSFVKRYVSEDGFRRQDDEQVDQVTEAWEAELDERDPENERFINLATRGSDVTQAVVTAPSGTAQFTATKQGRTYFLGKQDVNTVVVTVSAATKTLNTDYTLDAKAGTITIVPGGGIADAATVDVTFGCAQVKTNVYSADEAVLHRGTIRILEKNQLSKIPLRVIEFTGTIAVTAFPEHSGEVGKFSLRAVASTKPVITKRHAA